jgi:glyoxylase-like metal-dependent hydrolase (beta-lactamase superfamily II)
MRDWSIWSFCYATGRLPYDFLSGSPINSNRGTVEVPMIVSLLKSSDDELVLVDTGFNTGASMTGRNFDNFVRSDELLQRFGFAPEKIGKLVLTHMHFDHAGNLANFPNARIYLQRYEYDAWKDVIEQYGGDNLSKNNWAFSSLNVGDFEALEQAIAEGRVEFLDGDFEVAQGVHCRLARDTHTFGSQWLEIETRNGNYALAGDCCYTFQNLERMWPPGYTQGNSWNMLREFQKMKDVAGADLKRLIPGHDIELFTRFPSSALDGSRFIEASLAAGHASLLR